MEPGSAPSHDDVPTAGSILFDVFLSHNSTDKPTVRQLAGALVQRGVKVWLDEWELIPGRDWQSALEHIIEVVRSVAVLVGEDGLGPWEVREMRACINEFVKRKMPVIPVLLPHASAIPNVPLFLKSFTWVDFREGGLTEESLGNLIWGITGVKPPPRRERHPENETPAHPYSWRTAGEMAGRSFDELKSLIGSSLVRDLVIHFEEKFRSVRDQVAKLGDYKDLHDHLHEIEYSCHNLVAPQARRPDVDRIDWDLLGDAEITLQHILELLRDVQQRCCLPQQETAWIETLSGARADLQQANDNCDPKLLKRVDWLIGRTLRLELPQINVKLNHVAHELRLSVLVTVMKSIADSISDTAHRNVSIPHLEQGIEALLRLNQTLMSLVAQHDGWQRVNQELRLVEVSLEQSTEELKMAWPDLILRVEALYDTVTADWVVSVRKDATKLDQVIGAADCSEVRVRFRQFQRQVSNRFYRVDRQLKDLCENLRQIDGPLGSLLGEIE